MIYTYIIGYKVVLNKLKLILFNINVFSLFDSKE